MTSIGFFPGRAGNTNCVYRFTANTDSAVLNCSPQNTLEFTEIKPVEVYWENGLLFFILTSAANITMCIAQLQRCYFLTYLQLLTQVVVHSLHFNLWSVFGVHSMTFFRIILITIEISKIKVTPTLNNSW